MSIEKAFAIYAPPADIWAALWQELAAAREGDFEVESSSSPSLLTIRVTLGDMPARLTYRIEAREGHSEVAATLEPLSPRYRLYQLLTFGHLRRNYELLLVQGLSNLKRALEGEPPLDGEAVV